MIRLEEISVTKIEGLFLIKSYQRGYRWTELEVTKMLDDIYDATIDKDHLYRLQPIVVKNNEDCYELIDGQQRLTTLYLIMQYLKTLQFSPNYCIDYTTRQGSRTLLENICNSDLNSLPTNIDELFIKNSYKTIKQWFNNDMGKAVQFWYKLQFVTVIWYEVEQDEDSIEIFTRLNVGKIHLTNSELIKALFLSKGVKDNDGNRVNIAKGLEDVRQQEIALTWDLMEKELRDEKFWAFITNESSDNYPTRMELLFDMIVNKPTDADKYYTFFEFDKLFKDSEDKYRVWTDVVRDFQQLREWYNDFDMYHHIGYLVSIGLKISDLLRVAKGEEAPISKSSFKNHVISEIRKSTLFTEHDGQIDYRELSYESHYDYIVRLLLLFNVETIRQKSDNGNRFPFNRYKSELWSLEHIHAQNSESLKTTVEWKEWIESHYKSLTAIGNCYPEKKEDVDIVHNEMKIILGHIQQEHYNGSIKDEFAQVAKKTVHLLSDNSQIPYIHSLSNMALLSGKDNSVLNNSTFDVKREKIIEMDRIGEYIPLCTRNVFLKYYSGSNTQLHFWSEEDRRSYLQAINAVLYGTDDSGVRFINKEII